MQNASHSKPARRNYGAGKFNVNAEGVFSQSPAKDGETPAPQWLCSRLDVVAKTRDEHGNEWGRLLQWLDDDGNAHQWAVSAELLEGDGNEVRKELARQGLHIASHLNARHLLIAYIKNWQIDTRARCTNRLGWHGDVYVGAQHSFGETKELHIFQSAAPIESALSVSGSLANWRENVAALADGNSRLVFALSIAFAGPLVRLAGEDGGGIHVRGQSSCGKSTALNLAASVWGKPSDVVRQWRCTTNGLEGVAALHNDNVLILDELSQIRPEDAGEAAYMLGNGQGKTRASKTGTARPALQWRLLFLSAGEESLSALMAQGNKRSTAGQEIRLADIPADAGKSMGLFEDLHGYATPNEMAQALKHASNDYHGSAGHTWLEYLCANLAGLTDQLRADIDRFAAHVTRKGASGQELRISRRFGLVAVAGELASLAGLTGWPLGIATQAAETCFAAWLEGFGSGNHEERTIIRQTLAFLETHGSSRFEAIKGPDTQRIPNRAGFFRLGDDHQCEYLMTNESFSKEICQGHDPKLVKRNLQDAGILIPGKNGSPTHQARLPGLGNARVYVLRHADQPE